MQPANIRRARVGDTMIDTVIANKIYDILVEYVGANDKKGSWSREDFVTRQIRNHCEEFRFQGCLGFGGKFERRNNKWTVTCYAENMTPERNLAIEQANHALASLKSETTVD